MGMSFEGFDKGGSDKNNNSIYIAIDLKSFYASVECVERGLDPLTTNLVVADESRTEKTICLGSLTFPESIWNFGEGEAF